MKTKRIISFSLYGNILKYCVGAVRNSELAKTLYPGWDVRFYVSGDVPDETLKDLFETGAALVPFVPGIPPMFQRFLVADDPDCDRFLIRDADSRLSEREAAAVREWIATGKRFTVLRDHPAHALPIPGGLWGGRTGSFRIQGLMSLWMPLHDNLEDYGKDQKFLADMVWPFVHRDCLQHDSFSANAYPDSIPFPTKRIGREFCGEVIDENGQGRDFDSVQIPIET